jgi:hypothetical protein
MTFTNTDGVNRKVLQWYGDVRAEVRRQEPPRSFSEMDKLFFEIFNLMCPIRSLCSEGKNPREFLIK